VTVVRHGSDRLSGTQDVLVIGPGEFCSWLKVDRDQCYVETMQPSACSIRDELRDAAARLQRAYEAELQDCLVGFARRDGQWALVVLYSHQKGVPQGLPRTFEQYSVECTVAGDP
jgi:hypothetical protein